MCTCERWLTSSSAEEEDSTGATDPTAQQTQREREQKTQINTLKFQKETDWINLHTTMQIWLDKRIAKLILNSITKQLNVINERLELDVSCCCLILDTTEGKLHQWWKQQIVSFSSPHFLHIHRFRRPDHAIKHLMQAVFYVLNLHVRRAHAQHMLFWSL